MAFAHMHYCRSNLDKLGCKVHTDDRGNVYAVIEDTDSGVTFSGTPMDMDRFADLLENLALAIRQTDVKIRGEQPLPLEAHPPCICGHLETGHNLNGRCNTLDCKCGTVGYPSYEPATIAWVPS